MKLTWRKTIWLLLALCGLGLLVYAFLPAPLPVDMAVVGKGPLRVTVDEDGRTRIRERYVISAPLSGHLARITLKAGDLVEAGQTVLARLEPSDPTLLDVRARAEAEARVRAAESAKHQAEARIEHARAAMELAQHQFERTRRLFQNQALSREDFDTAEHRERMASEELRAAKMASQVAHYELEVAQSALIHTRPRTSQSPDELGGFEVKAPINGRVLRIFQESAAVVPAGTRLLELGDPTDLEIEIDVLSADGARIAEGAKVWLEHWGGHEPLLGRVRLVEPSAFLKISALGVEEQRVNVIADFVDPPEKRRTLGDGFRVEARIVVWEADDVLKVPAGALFRREGNWQVFVVEQGRAALRTVEVGQTNGNETQILEGLREGETIILYPGDRVQPGVGVIARE